MNTNSYFLLSFTATSSSSLRKVPVKLPNVTSEPEDSSETTYAR